MSALSRFTGTDRPDFSRVPVVVETGRTVALFFGLFSFVLVLMISIFLSEKMPGLVPLPVAAIIAVGAFFAVRHIALQQVRTVTIDNGEVCLSKKGTALWREPFSAFQGVLWHEEMRGTSKNRTLHQVIDLSHATDEARTVCLLDSQRSDGVRKAWEDAAGLLGLPALRETADGVERREPGELDMSVADRMRDGHLTATFDPDAPDGITWAGSDSKIDVVIRPRGRNRVMPMLSGGFFVGIISFVIAGFLIPLPPGQLFLIAIAVVFTAELLLFGLHMRIAVSPQEISHAVVLTAGLTVHKRSYRLDDIESVAVQMGIGVGDLALRLEADCGESRIALLNQSQADWLQNFVMSALAEAPSPETD